MKPQRSTVVISSLLILLFAYMAVSKFLSLASFRGVLVKLPFISLGAGVLAWAIPLAELCIVLLLLLPRTRWYGLVGSLIMMAVFTVYLGYMKLFVPHLPCSCGGVISGMGWGWHLLMNVGIAGLTAWSVVIYRREGREANNEQMNKEYRMMK